MTERLEDLIRRSAGEQRRRYRPTSDIPARVEARRRQRAARRLTAAGIGVAAIIGVIGFAATRSLGDGDIDVAASTSFDQTASTVAQESADWATTVPSTTSPPEVATAPDVTSTTPVLTPTTTKAPQSPLQQTSAATAGTTATSLHPDTPPAFAGGDGSVWPYGEFWNVPELGAERDVRGTGCGSSGEIGDVIPDGLFAGYITGHDDSTVSIDLLCIFAVPDVSALPSPGATVVSAAPTYVIVNNNTRSRTMPMDDDIVLRLGVRSGDQCVDGVATNQWGEIPADRQVWFRIHHGRVTWVFADCPPG
jgi:hypothetical protein